MQALLHQLDFHGEELAIVDKEPAAGALGDPAVTFARKGRRGRAGTRKVCDRPHHDNCFTSSIDSPPSGLFAPRFGLLASE